MKITDFKHASQNGTAWDQAVAAAVAAITQGSTNGDFTIQWPAGQYALAGPIFLPIGVSMEGDHQISTVLNRNFNASVAIQINGYAGPQSPLPSSGGALRRLALWGTAGTAPGFGVALYADPVYAPDYYVIEELLVTGPVVNAQSPMAWTTCLYMQGGPRSGPPGIRNVRISNCTFFGAQNQWWYLNGVVGLLASNCGFFVASGANITCDGSGVAGPCTNMRFSNMNGLANLSGSNGFLNFVAPTNSLFDGSPMV